MKGVIIYNPSYTGEGVLNQINALKREFSLLGVAVTAVSENDFSVGIKDGKVFCTLEKADFAIYLSKDIFTAKLLEKSGYMLVNSAKTIEICDDKALTYSVLLRGEVPIVDTLFPPRLYSGQDDEKFLKEAERSFGYPFIVKRAVGSLGSGVYKVENIEEGRRAIVEIGSAPHFYQQNFGAIGEDLRVIVIGGQAVASMKRVNKRDFRSNVELGGEGLYHELNGEEREIAESASRAVGADYCGVDILEENGVYKVCEVNSNAFFREVSLKSGVNVAKKYAEYAVKLINKA